MSDGDDFNISINGGNQQNVGKNTSVGQTMFGGQPQEVDFEQFLTELKAGIAASKNAPIEQDVEADIIEPLRQLAAQPEPENEQDRVTLKARIMEYLSQLEPYAPFIRKTIAAFVEGALSTLPPPAGWIIAGCVEVVRDAREG